MIMKRIAVLALLISITGSIFAQTPRKPLIIDDIQVGFLPLENKKPVIQSKQYAYYADLACSAIGVTVKDGMAMDNTTFDKLLLGSEIRVAVPISKGRQSKCF
jgi:hypothetical protein